MKTNITDEITRKEALLRLGKYAALTAVGTFLILNPKSAQAQSIPDPGNRPAGPANTDRIENEEIWHNNNNQTKPGKPHKPGKPYKPGKPGKPGKP
ncbi:hypothetical protein ES711_04815 [Gelidibacter salicanalis]|uniref:Uncharacterized protein n=1 Tax=Gelidibacter salicanalis TaxID=291193 RepID=A0A5C7ANV0_9FLAO|nr:hypothetical protein [Gelidibacter salicanalis]TXE09253.1 hypothetical protein ES711_04815 [Gelidibacter salicanalis]